MTPKFDISPEKEASFIQFLSRQFRHPPSPTSPSLVNLSGKTAIVTGSNGGIGFECCRQLLDLGLSKLILAVRNEPAGTTAASQLSSQFPAASIEVWKLDMSSYDSITNFVSKTKALERIDILILNAGITRQYFHLNPTTGHEENIQINYLSTVLLTILMLPALKSKLPAQDNQPSRVVIVTSDAGPWSSFPEKDSAPLLPCFDIEKPQGKEIDMVNRYYTSKLLQMFFLQEISERVPSSAVEIVATTPGLVYGTNAQRDLEGSWTGVLARIGLRLIGCSPEVGARQLTYAALREENDIHGSYFCGQKRKPLAPIIYTAKGQEISERLWRETMAELSFAGVEKILDQLDS